MSNGIKTFGIVSFVLSLILSGCMRIKDTSGIKQYFQDQGRAEILAVDIKAKNPDHNSPVYKEAEACFNKAAGTGNGWTEGIVLDAKMKREVNVSIQDYKNSDTGKFIEKFLSLKEERKINKSGLGTAIVVLPFIESLIEKIIEQNEKQIDKAIRNIEEQLSKARWTTFELTTSQWINAKYNDD